MSARIVVVAVVNDAGAVLLRLRDEQSAVRVNRWSLPGGPVAAGADAGGTGADWVRRQTGLQQFGAARQCWQGNVPGVPAEVLLYGASSTARTADLAQRPGYLVRFVPGPEVLNGRPFTAVSGFVLPWFLNSAAYRELAPGADLGELS